MIFSRKWSMPSPNTFSIKPIREFVDKYLVDSSLSVDPFSRDCFKADITNDLDPSFNTDYNMEAEEFVDELWIEGYRPDLILFDPPYSPRQISECYKSVGLSVGMKETQTASMYKRVRDKLDMISDSSTICLSFGWNSAGMGKKRGWAIEEIMLVAHGGAHNDTICLAERKL